MTIGDIKQAIRQRCRLDPRLTDAYMLNYIKQALAKFSMRGIPFKHTYTIDLQNFTSETKIFNLPFNFIHIDKIEIGTNEDFTNNRQTTLSSKDYLILKTHRNANTSFEEQPKLLLKNSYGKNYLIKIYYSAYIDDILDIAWNIDGGYVDNYIPYPAIQPLIEYVAYQHKKNYMKDAFTPQDYVELENLETDLYRIFNERVEII
ncbi:MAG: hypothetical protein NC918_02730 [Candidatus Omnitrophica bacterium]|nr:hypothetical protein [Candidatus Omnitrophota bacterium]